MSRLTPGAVEASVPAGAAFVVIGTALVTLHAIQPVFTDWLWAIVIGTLWVIAGSLLLFPDVRLYQCEQSPVELFLRQLDEH